VTGIGEGIATIIYTLPTGCAITTTVMASPMPHAGAVTGTENICLAHQANFTNPTCCGIWSSSDATIASVGSGSGIVTGLTPGVVSIEYTITNICGTSSAMLPTVILTDGECAQLSVENTATVTNLLKVSPNPTSNGNFSITLTSDNNEQADIVITNIVGEKVKALTTITNKKNDVLLEQPAGIYLITATTATGKYNEKITIE